MVVDADEFGSRRRLDVVLADSIVNDAWSGGRCRLDTADGGVVVVVHTGTVVVVVRCVIDDAGTDVVVAVVGAGDVVVMRRAP